MEPAPELASLVERLLRSYMSGDSSAVIDAVAHQPGALVIGFDDREWWEGYETIAAILRVQIAEGQSLEVRETRISSVSAWREGSVGWVALRMGSASAPSGPSLRLTMVLHEEGAYWRVVQWHTSVPVANEEVLGTTMTTSLDEILIAVQGDDAPGASLAGDGSVTIVFTDIEGSTALMESLGEARWLELLAWHDGVVRRQTAVFGGTVVKSQGDGYMLAFPAPGMAAACAVAVQRALGAGWSGVAIPVRIGIHCGNAKTEGGDFFGRTVVVAARVGAAAAGSEILVSQPVQDALGESFAFEGVRSAPLKGLAGQYALFPLRWR